MTSRSMRWLISVTMGWMGLLGLSPACAQVTAESAWPARAGRLVEVQGVVRVFDHEQAQWIRAEHNLPLTSGDRISTDSASRAELRIGSTTIRLDGQTDVLLRRIDDQAIDVELMAGSLALRATAREVLPQLSINTLEGRFQPSSTGHFRIDRRDQASDATAWRGSLDFQGHDSRLRIESGAHVELWLQGAPQRTHYRWQPVERDAFSDWVARDDTDADRSETARYVSTEMTGWEDLDRHGQWSAHPELGQVWMPTTVSATWEPYRDGRWHWVSPWGWTWVDAAPWGFAPFHYGRWVQWRGRWCWTPGPRSLRPVFAPALVTWQVAPHRGAGQRPPPPQHWSPLAPHDAFRRHPHPVPPVVLVDRVAPPPRQYGDAPPPLRRHGDAPPLPRQHSDAPAPPPRQHGDVPRQPAWPPTASAPTRSPRVMPAPPAPVVTSPAVAAPAVPTPSTHPPGRAAPPPGVAPDSGGSAGDGRRRGGAGHGVAPAPAPVPPAAPMPAAERKPGTGAPDDGPGRKRMPEQPKDQADKPARQ